MSDRNPPVFEFVTRDGEEPEVFFVDHEELDGKRQFRLRRPTFGVKRSVERFKGDLLSTPFPTEEAEAMAEFAAHIMEGLDSSPFHGTETKEAILALDDVLDVDLIKAVYSEVLAYWATFQRKK